MTLQFDLNRDIDGAARDVQAAINAARAYLPSNLPAIPPGENPTRRIFPSRSWRSRRDTATKASMYDAASSILAQKISQVYGVGQVSGLWQRAARVRVELNPDAVNKYNIGTDQIAAVLQNANANRPKGEIAGPRNAWQLSTTDQLFKAKDYKPLVVTYRNGAQVRVADLGDVRDCVEDMRNIGRMEWTAVRISFRLSASPSEYHRCGGSRQASDSAVAGGSSRPSTPVVVDRTTTIRASVHDVEVTLLIS